MLSPIFAAALAATLTCDPSVFRTCVYPQGAVTNSVLDPRGVPGATSKAEAFSRIEANAATAMLGFRDGIIQRTLWPVMNAECGGAKAFYQNGTNDLASVDFAPGKFAYTSSAWTSPDYISFSSPSNRVLSSPRILADAMERCANIISHRTRLTAEKGLWLVPGIDHMALCHEGVADGDAGSLIDFDKGAFLPLYRCIDDVTDPSNTSKASNIAAYGTVWYPAGRFSGYTADDSDPNAELGASCSATNSSGGYDLRIGPKMSDLLCAAAPGLPSDATSLNAIAKDESNPRILWYRFALANALLGITTDYFVPDARNYTITYYGETRWDNRDCAHDGYGRLFRNLLGSYEYVSHDAAGYQEWTCQGNSSDDSPIIIAQVYDESSDSYHWGAKFDIGRFKAGSVETNQHTSSSVVYGANLENTLFGWSDSVNDLSASVVVTYEGSLSSLNDTVRDDGNIVSSADLTGVPDGRYPAECFKIYDDIDLILRPHGRSEGFKIRWSQSDLVPENLRGVNLQSNIDILNADASAKIHAQRTVSSSGTFRRTAWMDSVSPYEEPPNLERAEWYNYLPVGMFPSESGLSQYVDFTLISILKAEAHTNSVYGLHIDDHNDHGTNITKNIAIKTQLKKHNIEPTMENLRVAQVEDRKNVITLMDEAVAKVKALGNGDPFCYSMTSKAAMTKVNVTDFTGDTKAILSSNDVAVLTDVTVGSMALNVYTDTDGNKVGQWLLDDPDAPAFTMTFALGSSVDYPKRYTPMARFGIDHYLYMKFKFPMFDCSGASWPAWTPNKEYEPKRPYKWEGEKNDDSSSSSTTSKETEQ